MVTIPGLTTSNVASESMAYFEAVQRTMENLTRTISKLRDVDMRRKLKDCQGPRTQSFQHLRRFIEGDKVWYQPLNGNYWFGPAAVLCQRGQSVWLHTHGDTKKVAACCVNPFELVDREKMKDESQESAEKRHIIIDVVFKS